MSKSVKDSPFYTDDEQMSNWFWGLTTGLLWSWYYSIELKGNMEINPSIVKILFDKNQRVFVG